MRLKRLSVRGFKSFADRTEFEFDSSLTGIVGPNGCGKSNVVDALKWVLGDQRARSLRGAEMTDVIFKGAEGRDGMHQAEVTVFLEDGNGGLGGRSEVTIGRRLTKDKESHYLLNGEPVRLKDVRDVLMDTGLGVGAYSVMEQGRIDAVLSANPESRRAVFEEAAGISKFKIQKRETLRKLERTEVNLARAKDLLDERSRRIRSLKIQAGRARRYRELQGELRDLKAALAVIDARVIREREHADRARLEADERQLAEAEAVCAEAGGRVAELDDCLAEADAELQQLQAQLRETQSRRDVQSNRATSAAKRAAELGADAESCAERLAIVNEQRIEREQGLATARDRLVELEERMIELNRELEQRRDTARAAQAEVKDLQTEREAARDRVLHWIQQRTRHRNQAHDCEAQLRGLRARRVRVAERLDGFRGERDVRQRELDEAVADLAHLAERAERLGAAEQSAMAELETADRDSADLTRLESGLRERLASVSSRLDVLESMEAHYEGVDNGPKFLLGLQEDRERAPGLKGRLVDALDVDLEHSKALEAALGPFVQALVVDTRANADAIVAKLRDERQGRVLLLVEEEFAEEFARPSALVLPEGAEFLVDHVRCDDEFRPLLHWLLRGVCLVESAESVDPKRPELCFVTPEGSLSCGPKIEGGLVDSQAGLVVRKAQIHTLRDEDAELRAQLGELQSDMAAAVDRAESLKDRARRLGALVARLRERGLSAEGRRDRLNARLADLARELETLELEQREVDQHRYHALAGLGEHLWNDVLIRRFEARESARETAAADRLGGARSHAEQAVRVEHDLRVQQAACSTDRDAHSHKVRDQERALLELTRTAHDLDERQRSARDGAEAAAIEARDSREDAERCTEAVTELDSRRVAVQERLASERQRRAEAQETVRDAEARRTALQSSVSELRLAVADSEHRFVRLEERLRDDTTIELRRCLGEVQGCGIESHDVIGPPPPDELRPPSLAGPPLPPAMLEPTYKLQRLWELDDFDVDASRKQAQVLQSQRDRLGSVNLGAVEELEAEEQKLGGLEKDVEDLTESRKSLMEALRKMETESRALFEQTFEQARENFRTIFRKLFQGGRADMYLTETEDALESGIEIVAKPPGKELQSIALLSGGERSLTALAILFAVFRVKPSPFCILDEVDAALDDTNVERFLRVLDDFIGPTQFCIVTHHKRTMAECQILYGITMQKRGVSTRIAVALDEVDSMPTTDAKQKATKQRIAGEEQVGF